MSEDIDASCERSVTALVESGLDLERTCTPCRVNCAWFLRQNLASGTLTIACGRPRASSYPSSVVYTFARVRDGGLGGW